MYHWEWESKSSILMHKNLAKFYAIFLVSVQAGHCVSAGISVFAEFNIPPNHKAEATEWRTRWERVSELQGLRPSAPFVRTRSELRAATLLVGSAGRPSGSHDSTSQPAREDPSWPERVSWLRRASGFLRSVFLNPRWIVVDPRGTHLWILHVKSIEVQLNREDLIIRVPIITSEVLQ